MELHLHFTAADEMLRVRAEQDLRAALRGRQDRIERVGMRVGMPRSEHQDAWCLVGLQLAGAPPFTVVHVNRDALAAVAGALQQTRRTVEALVLRATAALQGEPKRRR